MVFYITSVKNYDGRLDKKNYIKFQDSYIEWRLCRSHIKSSHGCHAYVIDGREVRVPKVELLFILRILWIRSSFK
jgi:hypothetical protein